MRQAFINTLIEETKLNKNIMLLTGDLGFSVFEKFRDKFPNNFINIGVAEQNMMGIAAGLAMSGKIVFAYSIATFATMRPFEQIRTDIASHNASVIVVGSGAGLSYGHDSITHHSVEDIHLMRAVPGMTILCPADPFEAQWATKASIKLKKPVYLRLGKRGEPVLYKKPSLLKVGKGSILKVGNDMAILATGNIVSNVLEAAKILSKKNIESTVVSMHTIKPLDLQLIQHLSKKFPIIITVEEHSIIGGLGSSVSEVISENNYNTKLIKIGVPDRFLFEIGSQNYLREKIGLLSEQIAEKILLLKSKK